MIEQSRIQAIARFLVGFGTEEDDQTRDYSLDFAGHIDYEKTTGRPIKFNPVEQSGYSLGSLQWDFGQGPELASPFVKAFVDWFANHPVAFPLHSTPDFVSGGLALTGSQLRNHLNKGLFRQDVRALTEFVKSDVGSEWVNTNIDVNLIGSDQQPNITVGDKKLGLTLVAIGRKIEETTSFKSFAEQGRDDTLDCIYAIGMKTYNQNRRAFSRQLMPFLSTRRLEAEIAKWYTRFSHNSGLYSGVGAATTLSLFWAKWKRHNPGVLLNQMQQETTAFCMANPRLVSQVRGLYVLAKQIFENTDRFEKFAHALLSNIDFVDPGLFDNKTGAIRKNPRTGRIFPGLLVKKKIGYVWDTDGNAYKGNTDGWSAIDVREINIKKLFQVRAARRGGARGGR